MRTMKHVFSNFLFHDNATYPSPGAKTGLSNQTMHFSSILPGAFGIVNAYAGINGIAVLTISF